MIFDEAFGPDWVDVVTILNAGSVDTFAELMGLAYQDGSDVVIGFDATTGIYLKNYTIAQLSPDDFVFV